MCKNMLTEGGYMGYIEEFYYGNIETQEFTPEFSKSLKKKLSALTEIERQLAENLKETESGKTFQKYVDAYNEFASSSLADAFINGFRHGAKFTLDTFK